MNDPRFPVARDTLSPRRWPHAQILAESGLVLGGILIIGWTLHSYPNFATNFPATTRPTLSLNEADREINSAKAYLATHPDDYNAYVAMAMEYFQKGPDYYVEAMNALDKGRALGATDEHLFFYAGIMYDTLGLPDYAINEYAKYLRHNPNDYETMIRLANLYFRQKKYDDAEGLYKVALQAWPKDVTAWFNYAVIQKEKGNYADAMSQLDHVEKITGHLPEGGNFVKGDLYRLQGDPTRAMQFYQQELAAQPEYLPALVSMEALMRTQGDQKQARLLHKRIIEVKKQQVRPLAVANAPVAVLPAATPIAPPTSVTPSQAVEMKPKHVRRRPPPETAAAPASATPGVAAPSAPSTSMAVPAIPTAAPKTLPDVKPASAVSVDAPAVAPAIPAPAAPTTSQASP